MVLFCFHTLEALPTLEPGLHLQRGRIRHHSLCAGQLQGLGFSHTWPPLTLQVSMVLGGSGP